MKIMYVASNLSDAGDLVLEREITELQRRLIGVAGEAIELLTFPQLPIEQLPLELSKLKPDILHISSHGMDGSLALANEAGDLVKLTADVLRVYLDIDRPPRLLYLNACDSREIAKQLAVQIPIVIGTTASISNRVARASAGLFYDRLLAGTTVQKAFEAGRATIALNNSSSCSELFSRADVDPSEMRLYQTPHIVARFVDSRFESDRFGYFEIEVGLKGCPADTTQVVFFTNDWNLVKEEDLDDKEDEYEIAAQLCRVVRATPVRGAIWSEWSEDINGDYLVCATGVTASGRIFAVSTMLCDALESHSVSNGSGRPSHSLSPAAARAISSLRQMDGSEAPSLADDPSPRNIRSSSVPRPRVGNQVRIRTRKKGPKGARKLGRPVKR